MKFSVSVTFDAESNIPKIVINPDCKCCAAIPDRKTRCFTCTLLENNVCRKCGNPPACLSTDKVKAALVRERYINLPGYIGVHKHHKYLLSPPKNARLRYVFWEQASRCNSEKCCKFFVSYLNVDGSFHSNQLSFNLDLGNGFNTILDTSSSLLQRNDSLKLVIANMSEHMQVRSIGKYLMLKTDDEAVNAVRIQNIARCLIEQPYRMGSFNKFRQESGRDSSLYRQCLWYVRNLYYFRPEILLNPRIIPFTIISDIKSLDDAY